MATAAKPISRQRLDKGVRLPVGSAKARGLAVRLSDIAQSPMK
jgi:hypothetical protein